MLSQRSRAQRSWQKAEPDSTLCETQAIDTGSPRNENPALWHRGPKKPRRSRLATHHKMETILLIWRKGLRQGETSASKANAQSVRTSHGHIPKRSGKTRHGTPYTQRRRRERYTTQRQQTHVTNPENQTRDTFSQRPCTDSRSH